MANEVVSFSSELTSTLDAVQVGLPEGFNKLRFVNNAVALLNENPGIAQYSRAQIIAGLMKAAYLGLDVYAKECYLIPYGNMLQFQVDYRGSKKLVKKYSIRPVLDIFAEIVREGDSFETYIEDCRRVVNFHPKAFNDGPVIGAFAVCQFKDGGIAFDSMSLKELETSRSSSRAANSPAWKKFTNEMYRKTILHRLCKQIEIDFTPEQRAAFDEEVAIETDPRNIRDNDVEANANTIDFPEG